MKQTNRKGFTLAELLIVVAIIAVLVAIAIPVFTKQLHNARVATDQANLRAYYAELQANYQETGKSDSRAFEFIKAMNFTDYKHLDNSVSSLKEGTYYIRDDGEKLGYSIVYNCKDLHDYHEALFSNNN